MTGVANAKFEEADEKEKNADRYIKANSIIYLNELGKKNKEIVKQKTDEARAKYTGPTYAFGLYSLIVTVVLLLNHWDILATTPQWFKTRIDHLNAFMLAIDKLFMDLHDVIPVSWTEIARYGIPIVVFLGLAIGFVILALKLVILPFKGWNEERWNKYTRRGTKDRRKAFTAFWCALSLLMAIMICWAWKDCPVNYITLYLVFSFVAYVFYHGSNSENEDKYW